MLLLRCGLRGPHTRLTASPIHDAKDGVRGVATLRQRVAPRYQLHSPRCSYSSGPSRVSAGHRGSSFSPQPSKDWLKLAAGAGGLATTLWLLQRPRPPIQAEAPPQQESKEHQHSKSGFAPPIESEDDEPHPNFVLRGVYAVGRFIRVYIIEPVGTAKRFVHLFILFFPVILAAPMLLVGHRREAGRRRGRRVDKKEEGQRWGAMWWYGFLVKQMERAGPTFTKLGQWAGSRQDLFPHELCEMLGKLHSNGKAHSFKYTKKSIERVFQRPFDEIFEEFEEEPMGIGAVGQVYRAKLRPDLLPPSYLREKKQTSKPSRTQVGRDISQKLALSYDVDSAPPAIPTASVAIKILHPKMERTIGRDIKIMSFFARVLNMFPGAEWLSLPEEVDVFAGLMFSQLDLRNEAQNLLRFEDNFRVRRSAVSFPRPLTQFSTKELLIEEYEEALPLKAFLKNGGANFDHRIANLGLDAFLNMLLLDNFTHADLHPGNIMIKFYKPTSRSMLNDLFKRILSRFDSSYAQGAIKGPPSAEDQTDENIVRRLMPLRHDQEAWLDELDALDEAGYQPELVFIDAGLTVELTPTNRRNFLDLFGAVATFDGALAGHLMVERCRSPEKVVDQEKFAMRMQDLVMSVKSKTFSLGKIKISEVLGSVLGAVRDHHVKMEADFVNTVISILLLEGIGRQLDPNMDLFRSAVPILRSLGRQLSHGDGGMSDLPGNGAGEKQGGSSLKDLAPMLKIWFALEARAWLLNVADKGLVDAFVRYDWLGGA